MGLNNFLHILFTNEKYQKTGINRANYVSTVKILQKSPNKF